MTQEAYVRACNAVSSASDSGAKVKGLIPGPATYFCFSFC